MFIGNHNVDLFEKYVLNDQHTVCDFDSLNLYSLLLSVFNKNSNQLRINYYLNFISHKSSIILTFTDNYKNLSLKNFSNKNFYFNPKWMEGELGDFFDEKNLKNFKKEKLQSDYILVFNDVIGINFKKLLIAKLKRLVPLEVIYLI